jgi:signal transduction histidine kinase
MMKTKDLKNSKIIMQPATSPGYMNWHFTKEVEDQFNNSGDLFSQAIENADGVPYQFIFGPGAGKGYFLNVGYGIKRLFNIIPDELTEGLFRRMIVEVIPLEKNIPKDPVAMHEKIISGEIKRYKAEMLIMTPAGEKKYIRDSALPVTDDRTGKVIGLLGIFVDITEYRVAQQQLDKVSEKASEGDRLKTAFLNNLSHEIRTPLNAIVGFSTLLGEPGHNNKAHSEYLDIITRSSDHLLEILDDVVEISKIETKVVRITRKEVNLSAMLQRIYDRFRAKADEKDLILRYDAHVDEQEIVMITDGYKLFQSITNLVSNAIKFTKQGKVEFGYRLKDGKIEFYVNDTGIGIGEEHKPHIFKPFYQAESISTKRYEGTGLGLSIAKAYIELLGGTIMFTSTAGEGSVFWFTLPFERRLQI